MIRNALLVVFLFLALTVQHGDARTRSTQTPRIVGGTNAGKVFVQSMAALFYQSMYFCGGTVIGDKWILSAAHCFFDYDTPETHFVFVGVKKFSKMKTNSPNRYSVANIYKHADYVDVYQGDDVAILELASAIPPAKLFPVEIIAPPAAGKKVWAAGWGDTAEGGNLPSQAQKVKLQIGDFNACDILNELSGEEDEMFCAHSIDGLDVGGQDSCQGDSGGPLFRKKKKVLQLVGIVSWGYGCARPNFAGWYAKAITYKSAIEDVINTGSSSDFNVLPL